MKIKRIGDISIIVSKGTTPTSIGLSFANRGIPFLRGEDVQGKRIDFESVKTFIDKKTHSLLSRSALSNGDVLVTIAGTIGRVAYIEGPAVEANCNQAVAFIRIDPNRFDASYLCFLLSSPQYQSKFDKFVAGGGIPNVNLEQIKSIEIHDISIEDQRRIVSRLKAQLSEVEMAHKAAEMQATELANIIELAIENEISVSLANGKREVFLGDIVDLTAKLVDPTTPEMCILPHVSAENIASVTGEFLGLKSAAEDGMKSNKYMFESGDVLYSKLRPYLRKVALPDFAGLCSADMYPLKANPEFIDSRFLKILLSAKIFTEYANEKSARSRMPKLNREQLFSWEFRLPSLERQKACIEKIEKVVYQANIARKAAKIVATEISLLPSRLLSQAFEM